MYKQDLVQCMAIKDCGVKLLHREELTLLYPLSDTIVLKLNSY